MKCLSDKIIIKDLFCTTGKNRERDFEEKYGVDFPIKSIERSDNGQYYKIETSCPKEREIVIGAASDSIIGRVKFGIFKDGVCVIECCEGLKKETSISVIMKDGVFKYPKIKRNFKAEDLEYLLSEEGLCDVLARELNVFDISKRYQNYEFMCENLPHRFWKNLDLVAKVNAKFSDLSSPQLINVQYPELVRGEGVRRRAIDFFNEMERKKSGRFEFVDKLKK